MVNLKDSTAWDYTWYVFSFALLIFSAVVTFYAIVEQKTSFWKACRACGMALHESMRAWYRCWPYTGRISHDEVACDQGTGGAQGGGRVGAAGAEVLLQAVPGWAALGLFILVLLLLGVMEGLQIALMELKLQDPASYSNSHPRAYRLGALASQGDNIERFLMGRQVFVVCLVFFAAKLTTIHGRDPAGFLFPVPEIVQAVLLETGLLACVIVVIVAQLAPQIVASLYPVQFLELCVSLPAYWACIALETTGVTHFTWVLAGLATRAGGIREEVNNNGTKEEEEGKEGSHNTAYMKEL